MTIRSRHRARPSARKRGRVNKSDDSTKGPPPVRGRAELRRIEKAAVRDKRARDLEGSRLGGRDPAPAGRTSGEHIHAAALAQLAIASIA